MVHFRQIHRPDDIAKAFLTHTSTYSLVVSRDWKAEQLIHARIQMQVPRRVGKKIKQKTKKENKKVQMFTYQVHACF